MNEPPKDTMRRGEQLAAAMLALPDSYKPPDALVIHSEDHVAVHRYVASTWATFPLVAGAETMGGMKLFVADQWLSRGQAVAVWFEFGRMVRVERIEWTIP